LERGLAELLPWEPPVPHARGLVRFGEAEYGPEMQKTVRIYPHHFDSEGGFIAVLRRSLMRWKRLLREFGVEEIPGELLFRHDAFWLTTAQGLPKGVKIHAVGIRLVRVQKLGLKPTSFGLMFLGPRIQRRRVELTREELRELLLGHPLRKPGLPQGFVALSLEGEVVGCGEVRGELLRCQIPGPEGRSSSSFWPKKARCFKAQVKCRRRRKTWRHRKMC
jgi:NOL1/NOP2/fmu family ribosome biogenesis protein